MDGLFIVRGTTVLLGLIACGIIIWRHERAFALLRKFFREPTSPINLAIVRVIVFYTLFESATKSEANFLASLPRGFQSLPRGWVWLADTGLFDSRVVHVAIIALIVSTALAMVGALTPVATVVASACAILVFGVENFYFKIGHSLHVPTLSACVLAASPAGDALSVDALVRRWRKKPRFEPSTAYTVPVRFCWLLVGTIYLFPGLWKLWETGDQWFDGSKLSIEMFDKWAQLPDFAPTYRFDRAHTLLMFLGSWTIVIEVGIFFMIFARATRVAAALFASSFHIGVGLTLGIWFSPFVPLILLADIPEIFELRAFRPLLRLGEKARARLSRFFVDRPERPTTLRNPRWTAASMLVGSFWLAGMFIAGLGPVDTWPIAIYPRFADRKSRPTSTGMTLGFVHVRRDGSEHELPNILDVLGDSASAFRVARTVIRARQRKDYRTLTRFEELFVRCAERVMGPLQQGEQLRVVY
ncbi:MAG TPA: hypothetical protein VFQ35_11255, partial [Polyangiaceae bacterium]|nr:hypothetical protein [Polyangiaceae bacterium]